MVNGVFLKEKVKKMMTPSGEGGSFVRRRIELLSYGENGGCGV